MQDQRQLGYQFSSPVLVDVGNYPPVDRHWHTDYRSTGNATDIPLFTPPSAQSIVITDLNGSLSANGSVTIFHGINEAGHRIIDIDVTANVPFGGYILLPYSCPAGEQLSVTTTGGGNLKLTVWGFTRET